MTGRHFKLRIALIGIYVAVVVATGVWVLRGWPASGDDQLAADVDAVPGALQGRTLVLVTNASEQDWHDVELVLNEHYVVEADTIAAGEQHSVPIDEFTYLYLVPTDRDRGVWHGVSPTRQPRAGERLDITPTSLVIRAREGEARREFPGAAPRR